jgi:hypothetical protein
MWYRGIRYNLGCTGESVHSVAEEAKTNLNCKGEEEEE